MKKDDREHIYPAPYPFTTPKDQSPESIRRERKIAVIALCIVAAIVLVVSVGRVVYLVAL